MRHPSTDAISQERPGVNDEGQCSVWRLLTAAGGQERISGTGS